MDKSKTKNFIIVLLILVNGFLLYLVGSNALETKKTEDYRRQALINVLLENGITVSKNVDLTTSAPASISLSRDLKKEKDRVSSLIGRCTADDEGGNIFSYKGGDGEFAKFRGSGEFEILLDAEVLSVRNGIYSAAGKAMNKLGLDYSVPYHSPSETQPSTEATLYCAWGKTPIYNAQVKFYSTTQSLTTISGIRPFDTVYLKDDASKYPDCITMLMSFLEYIHQRGTVCNEIIGAEPGYFMDSTISGDCTLRPVWRITTDVGSYYFDALTGNSESLTPVN